MHFRSLYCTVWHRSNAFRLVSENNFAEQFRVYYRRQIKRRLDDTLERTLSFPLVTRRRFSNSGIVAAYITAAREATSHITASGRKNKLCRHAPCKLRSSWIYRMIPPGLHSERSGEHHRTSSWPSISEGQTWQSSDNCIDNRGIMYWICRKLKVFLREIICLFLESSLEISTR